MGGSDAMDKAGTSDGAVYIDIDDEDDYILESPSLLQDLDEEFLKNFCRKASTSFFRQYGLISHQLNSYNDFIKTGIQNIFDSIGEIVVEPGYDSSKKGDEEWKYASVKFGKVTLDPPMFWTGDKFESDSGKHLKFRPRHARLQNMTYSSSSQ